jgi:hypothetical protein
LKAVNCMFISLYMYDVQLRSDKLSRCQFKIVCCVFTSFVKFVYPCVVSGIVSKLFLIHQCFKN